jgi:hypothetical protein
MDDEIFQAELKSQPFKKDDNLLSTKSITKVRTRLIADLKEQLKAAEAMVAGELYRSPD